MAKSTRSRSAERLVDILVELHLHGVVNRSALMDKFKITERTVYRDLNALSPIVEHTGNGLYRLIHSAQSPGSQGLHHTLANFLNADNFFPIVIPNFGRNSKTALMKIIFLFLATTLSTPYTVILVVIYRKLRNRLKTIMFVRSFIKVKPV